MNLKTSARHLLRAAIFVLTPLESFGDPVTGGKLVLGHEVREFVPCGSSSAYWLDGESGLMTRLHSRYQSLSTGPYDPVYAELSGIFAPEPGATGFAADYDGVFRIGEIAGASEWQSTSCSGGQQFRRVHQAWVLECPGKSPVVISSETGGGWLFRNIGSIQLEREHASGQTIFTAPGLEITLKGESGIIIENGVSGPTCTNNRRQAIWERSKLNGADFRAVGNEPGWVLEIMGQSLIVFVADYGKFRVELPLPEPTTDDGERRTIWNAGELLIQIDGQLCADTMSGEQFETAVTVLWNEREYRGCGRALH